MSKKVVVNPISSKTKVENYYSWPILNIVFRKWFPLFEVPSPKITLEELVSLTNQEH